MCTYLMKISAIGGLEKSRILTGLLPQVSSLDRTFENRILERSTDTETLFNKNSAKNKQKMHKRLDRYRD